MASLGEGLSIDTSGNLNAPPKPDIANLELGPLAPQQGPSAPYTPAEVAAAKKVAIPAVSSPFSSSSAVVNGSSQNSAVDSATKTLTQVPVQQQTFSYQGNQFNYAQLPNGMSTTPPTGSASTMIATPFGPVYVSTGTPVTSSTNTSTLPQGYAAGTPDPTTGAISYTGPNGNSILNVPSNFSGNVTSLLNTHAQAQTDINTAIPGANLSMNTDGSGVLTLPDGTTQSISVNTLNSWATSGSQVTGAISSAQQTNTANKAAAQTQIDTINTQLAESLQQLQLQQDAALGEAGAGSGGFGKSGETGIAARFDTLIQNAKNDAQNQINSINASLGTTNASVASNLQDQLSKIEQSAQSTTIQQQQFAQQQFSTIAKTFDVSTAQFATGTNLQNLTIGANGTTGNAATDALIQQGVAAGFTPQQALGLVQAGVATQNKSNQAQFLGLLQQASYANGWANMTPAQLQADPLFNAYTGMAQSYIPSLANNPQAARALVSGGTIQQQKLSITTTGSPTDATPQTLISATPPDATIGDTTGAGIATGTKYTPNAIYDDAIEYAMTGKVPSLGLGSAAQVQLARAAINNVAAAVVTASGSSFPSLQALYKANSSAATQSVQRLARISIVENSATANFPRLQALADKVKASGITITESDLQAGSAIVQQKTGSADAASYVELVNTIRSDYSAMQSALAGARGGQYFAETAAQAIPLGLTSDQYAAIANTITLNAQNATNATNGEVQDLLSISGGSGSVPDATGTTPTDTSGSGSSDVSSASSWPGF